MDYEQIAQREVLGYWHAILGTLQQRNLLKPRPQQGGYIVPQALGILDKERAYFVLDMLRLAGVSREKWLDRDLWRQWRAALSGRKVCVADGYGLVICVARTPGLPNATRLPAVIPLEPDRIPEGPYTVTLGQGKQGDVALDLAGAHRAILTGGTSGAGKTNLMQSIILQLCAKHSSSEFQVAIVDTKQVDFAGAFDRLPNLFGEIAHTVENSARLIEAVEQERRRRQAVMASEGVADWRALAEPFSLLLLVVDEAADFARDPAMDTLVEVARKGRAFGVSIVLGTQLPSARVINPQVRANLPTAIAFQCRTHLESQAILGTGGAEALDRPGLALAFLDGKWQTMQTLRVDAEASGLAERVSVPPTPALEPLHAAMVRYALEDLGGAFIIGRLYEQFGAQISKRQLTRLGQRWEMRGWLTTPAHATDPRRVTDELAALAGEGLPPGQGAVSGDTVIGVIGGDRSSKPVIGTGDRASGPVIGAMTGTFPIPTYS